MGDGEQGDQGRIAAIVGAGLIGRGWAIVFARAGWRVVLSDLSREILDKTLSEVAGQAEALQAYGLSVDSPTLLGRIATTTELAEACRDADLVMECGPEVLETKRDLFAAIAAAAPETAILASSTSGIMASRFSEHLEGRERVIVAHPVNPPHLVPIVELAPAPWTSERTLADARAIFEAVGQVPILVRREITGFILNRLQAALLNEAMRLAEGGYAAPEDIDKTVRDGLGLRWSFMGPFETIDLNAPGGLRDYAARYGAFLGGLAENQTATPNWGAPLVDRLEAERRRALAREDLDKRARWRDHRLMALLAHKRSQDTSA